MNTCDNFVFHPCLFRDWIWLENVFYRVVRIFSMLRFCTAGCVPGPAVSACLSVCIYSQHTLMEWLNPHQAKLTVSGRLLQYQVSRWNSPGVTTDRCSEFTGMWKRFNVSSVNSEFRQTLTYGPYCHFGYLRYLQRHFILPFVCWFKSNSWCRQFYRVIGHIGTL